MTHTPDPDTGVQRIAAERRRQLVDEQWEAERDARLHTGGELALAAACYALPHKYRTQRIWDTQLWQRLWPWATRWWKPTTYGTPGDTHADRIRELEKAGALVAAEIDRLLAETRRETP